ncbi:MAG: endopeptidase La [Gammaproteobacteria bacterium]|jgi:ATP-dependent Lon protease|nr:endopeptidase La [Gammaproteobacteria bacterium]
MAETPAVIKSSKTQYPVLPLRDVVVYPHMVIPLFVGREKSVNALEAAMTEEQKIFLVSQQNPTEENPTEKDLYQVGTIASILQLLRLPDGTLKVLVEGVQRAKVAQFVKNEQYICAELEIVKTLEANEQNVEALLRSLVAQFDHYIKLNKKIPPEVMSSLVGIDDPVRLVDTIAAHMTMKIEDRQKVLELQSLTQRIEELMNLMENEIEILQIEKRIRGRVKRQMEKNQREYYLNEQMKAIQKELGEIGEGYGSLEALEKKIAEAKMPKEALEKTMAELRKLKSMSSMSAEAAVSRNYIDTMIAVPWTKATKVKHDLALAEKILNEDHHGLEKVKERILEYLAVQQRVRKLKGPILCLVGPPGVGKTSLGASIARATGRKFVRVALGGIRDEAEIRGHRRTYVGSMPGKIIQKLSKVGTKNPLFLLDEIDKMAMDFRGDPSSALLEVLDPEQNHAFNDHYLEVDYDLSEVMFIATANSMDIPTPLLDRMEVIRLAGYTEDEKLNIAIKYLIPKHMKSSGLKKTELIIDESVVIDIVRYYTRESGVRSLEREINKICRKAVKAILLKPAIKSIKVTSKNLEDYLGVHRYRYGLADEHNEVGQVTGLAWTEVGGELLKIEASAVPGKGKTQFTGKLGDVMQESIQAAMTVVRSRSLMLGIAPNFYEKLDIHIHVPEGAIPKDGPSAGIAMCTALVSVLTNTPVRADVAMTGEITLRGEVLPIGGLKEKLLAAHRGGTKLVLIPEENRRDLKDIPAKIKNEMEIRPVRWIDEVLEAALAQPVKRKMTSLKRAAKLSKSSEK